MPSVEHYAYLMYTKPRSPSSVHKKPLSIGPGTILTSENSVQANF
jgi:hypothetical protein